MSLQPPPRQKPHLIGLALKVGLAAVLLGGMAGAVLWDSWQQQRVPPMLAAGVKNPLIKEEALPAPNVPFTTLDGRRVNAWTEIETPEVRVHFWASWCPTCLVEMPRIMAYARRHVRDTTVVMVSTDDNEAAMRKAMARYGQEPVLWVWDKDKALSLKTFQTINVPETVRLDAQRRMVDKWVGEAPWE